MFDGFELTALEVSAAAVAIALASFGVAFGSLAYTRRTFDRAGAKVELLFQVMESNDTDTNEVINYGVITAINKGLAEVDLNSIQFHAKNKQGKITLLSITLHGTETLPLRMKPMSHTEWSIDLEELGSVVSKYLQSHSERTDYHLVAQYLDRGFYVRIKPEGLKKTGPIQL